MGEMEVPANAYYGAQTERARHNFPISKLRIPRAMIRALGMIKLSAAEANSALGLLDDSRAKLIKQAALEVAQGKLDEHFVVDIFQTGSGTSTNMNSNEVIANRAAEMAEEEIDVHPNDHVNMSQSSNDVIPTAIHVAACLEIHERLLPALAVLESSVEGKSKEFAKQLKTGRTHLQDATPMTLGQEFGGYQRQIELGRARLESSLGRLRELAQGGTAVGTGLNTHPEFAARVIANLSRKTGFEFVEAVNHFEAQAARDAVVEMSGQLRTVATSMHKIANDLRWLASGPRCGLAELNLPAVQPGSSIMPGKVNPVIAESVLMASAQVIGNDACIAFAGSTGGTFELNVMLPVIAHNLIESISILSTSAENFAKRCIDGIEANEERLSELAEASIAICTALAPHIGYDKTAKLAKEAFETGRSVRELAKEQAVLPPDELDQVLDLMRMTKPGLQ